MVTLVQVPGRSKWHIVDERGETVSQERTLEYGCRVAAFLMGTPPAPVKHYGRWYTACEPSGCAGATR